MPHNGLIVLPNTTFWKVAPACFYQTHSTIETTTKSPHPVCIRSLHRKENHRKAPTVSSPWQPLMARLVFGWHAHVMPTSANSWGHLGIWRFQSTWGCLLTWTTIMWPASGGTRGDAACVDLSTTSCSLLASLAPGSPRFLHQSSNVDTALTGDTVPCERCVSLRWGTDHLSRKTQQDLNLNLNLKMRLSNSDRPLAVGRAMQHLYFLVWWFQNLSPTQPRR